MGSISRSNSFSNDLPKYDSYISIKKNSSLSLINPSPILKSSSLTRSSSSAKKSISFDIPITDEPEKENIQRSTRRPPVLKSYFAN